MKQCPCNTKSPDRKLQLQNAEVHTFPFPTSKSANWPCPGLLLPNTNVMIGISSHLIYGVTELEMVTKNNNKIRRESEERTTAASSILTKLLKPRTTAAKLARAKLKQCQEKTATVMMQCDRSAVVYYLL
jgi:hypothetical protein